MPENPQGDVTQLLAQWGHGDRAALDAATRMVYGELRKIAESYLHMSANRMFRGSPNMHEVVLYEFLARTYQSRLARAEAPHARLA